MINLSYLEGFYWVATTGGYARAARAFPYPITHAGVHHQVRKLERQLETRLFERAGRDTMRLTAAGEALFDYAKGCFERLPGVVESVRSHSFGGVLRVHSSRQLIGHLLPSWLYRLRQKRPDICVELHELEGDPLALLREHDTDLVVEHLPALPEWAEGKQVAVIRSFVILPPKHPIAKKRFRPSLLRQLPFVSYVEGSAEWAIQRRGLATYGVKPEIAAWASSAESLTALVAAGVGFSAIPAINAAPLKNAGVKPIAVRHPDGEFPVLAAYRKSAQNPLTQALIDII